MDQGPLQLGLIVNPSARRVRQRYLSADRFWDRHLGAEAVFETADMAELDRAIRDLRARGVRVVACLGGDGTLHHVVSAVLRHYPPAALPVILPLAGGTLNCLATAFGTGGPPERALASALSWLERGRCPKIAQASLWIDGSDGAEPRIGFTFAAGLVTRAARQYYARGQPGPLSVLRVTLAASLGPAAPTDLRVSVDGGPATTPRLVVAGTVSRPFLWFRPFGAEQVDPGSFGITQVAMTPLQVAPRLWAILRGRSRHPGMSIRTARTAEIETQDGFVLDGEIYASGPGLPIRLSSGPELQIFDLIGLAAGAPA